tara:strand:+ start:960 stop:1091 length:132 start_codon:yes stop_codon:yes gene_type:complete
MNKTLIQKIKQLGKFNLPALAKEAIKQELIKIMENTIDDDIET